MVPQRGEKNLREALKAKQRRGTGGRKVES
jgi:hypothetical protein